MEAQTFEQHRPRLINLAYRMLGSVASAEDIVQETWIRWAGASEVHTPAAWLTTVCTRLCLDELSSARVKREQHVGPWLPEPWISDEPAQPGPLGSSLSMAFLLLLEELSPRERAAFLLREIFEEEYEHIALVLDTTSQNVRQWVRRAKEAIEADRPRFDVDPAAQSALLAAFGAAVASGDPKELEALLAHDVIATSDGGGRVHAARVPIYGPQRVAKFLLGVLRLAPAPLEYEPAWVNGMAGIIVKMEGQIYSVVALEGLEGQIRRWRSVVDPLKLGHLQGSRPRAQ